MDKPWYKKWWGVLISVSFFFALILLVAFSFYVLDAVKSNTGPLINKETPVNEDELKKIEGNNNYWLGSANPKITIVEFADYQCPLCKNSYPKIREISTKYKDSVKIIHRDFPLYENSIMLSLAARCAGEQGIFWVMHDKLFQNQKKFDPSKPGEIIEIANQIGADINKFSTCVQEEKYITDIRQDFSDAEYLKVKGTPTWFINGQKIEGDIPYKLFIKIIEDLLNF